MTRRVARARKTAPLQLAGVSGRGLNKALLLACWILLARGDAHAQLKPLAAEVSVDEHVGERIPLELRLRDQSGANHRLGDYFEQGKPVLLALAYYHCPGLCDVSLRDLAARVRELGLDPDADFAPLTLSIDPRDTPMSAGAKRANVLSLAKPGDKQAWPFLVAEQPAIAELTAVLGYHYDYDAATAQYAHPAVTIVLTPDAKIARYVYGPTTELQTLRLALREARLGRGGVSSLIDRTVLSCFRYDPSTRRYHLLIASVMRGGAGLILLALGIAITVFIRRGRAERAWPNDASA